MKDNKVVAVVLAAGVGKRMESNVPKQYILIEDKPIIYFTLKAFDRSNVDEIILVTGENEIEYCTRDIVQYFNFNKKIRVIAGGRERYNSVYNGLSVIKDCDYVLIHDGARPCIMPSLINKVIEEVKNNKACIVAVPVKDTIKIVEDGAIKDSPNRNLLWSAQTPQAFSYAEIYNAYENIIKGDNDIRKDITDDAQVWSIMNKKEVKIVEGNYENIKITTPSDMEMVVNWVKKQ